MNQDTLFSLPKTGRILPQEERILHLDLSSLADDTRKTEELLDKGLQLFHRQLGPCPPTIWALPGVRQH